MRKPVFFSPWTLAVVLFLAGGAYARAQYSDAPSSQEGGHGSPQQIPESGPKKSVGETVIVPRQRPEPAPEPPKSDPPAKPDEQVRFSTDVDLVSVGVVVQDRNGNFVSGLKPDNFRLLEDGVPQKILSVEASEAPMTVVLVIEYSDLFWEFMWQTLQAAYGFVESLKPDDWVALIAYDLKSEVIQDFTRNKSLILNMISSLRAPAFTETNLFDAITDAVQRMQDVEGKKAILLISSGIDTFSKTRYGDALKIIQASDTPIYAIGTGQAVRMWYDSRGYMDSSTSVRFLQADNQLRSFAKLSGGKAYFPRFEGEFPSIYADISASLRNEYVLTYRPTNTARDGKYRKIKVELVDLAGKPLKITDQKGKEIKYEVRAREGYTAPRPVE